MTDTLEERAALAEKYARGEVRTVVTEDDLEWWYRIEGDLEWRWARTFAKSAPHWYIQRERTQVLTLEEYHRALRVIWTFGTPEKFYRKVNIALRSRDGQRKWFTSNMKVEDSLINMATTEHVYGTQDVPSTESLTPTPVATVYDHLATAYDERYETPECRAENAAAWKHVVGERAVTDLLDIGAGAGLALDLKMVPRGHPENYRAIDPSQGMLNALIYKHQWVRDIWPMTFEAYLDKERGERAFDTVISLFGSPSYIAPEAIERLPELTSSRLVLMHYREGYLPDYDDPDLVPHRDSSREAAAGLPGAQVFSLNNFQVVVVDKR